MTVELGFSDANQFDTYRFRRRAILSHPRPRDLRAKVFEDQDFRDSWRVEKLDVDGATCHGAIFSGRAAREQSIRYADREYGDFELAPCPQRSYHWPS